MVNWAIAWGGVLLLAYLLGSLPTGYLAARLLKGIDIREVGSGSTGATNVLRTLGKGPGATVLLIDVLKGVAAIALAQFASSQILTAPWDGTILIALAGLIAVLGHSKSVWLGFTGGKSVATSLGVLFAMNLTVALGAIAAFALVVAITRIVSISSISGAIAVAILMVVLRQPIAYQVFGIAGGLYVIWRHRSNIERLLAGTEPKLGEKVAESTSDSG